MTREQMIEALSSVANAMQDDDEYAEAYDHVCTALGSIREP